MEACANPFETHLDKNAANYVPLSPLSFLERTAGVAPERPSVVYEDRRFTWGETAARCRRFASALARLGVGCGDAVSVMLPNVPAMYEAHFAAPMTGAVLNTLNTRLDAESLAFMLSHAGAKVVLVDPEFADVMEKALALVDGPAPYVIDVDDAAAPRRRLIGAIEYETFIEGGDPAFAIRPPDDEWSAIALNYTSGTTGDPKGVVYHHRGAYLASVSNILAWGLPQRAVYLWTLPMFHCNGWCFPWAMAAVGGLNVCLRKVDPAKIFELIRAHRVTHMCGAPIVYNLLVANAEAAGGPVRVEGLVAGAPPPKAVIAGAERLGLALTHVYGLTETFGPASICAQKPEWAQLSTEERAHLNRRQGVAYPLQQEMAVLDPTTLEPAPADGETIGEIMFRGNIAMKGYLKNPEATRRAFEGGYLRTGDLAARDPDGYVVIKDRSKDVIISGGENISSVEVEDALCQHPSVMMAAVVATPDPKWGEVPCAFIELRPGAAATEAEIVAFCRQHLAAFKIPRKVVFCAIPKTATGKMQKYLLRQQARSADAIY
ncbi:acyl-CoA synthetase [Methylocella sp.]|uniref:acyl-CoA synthetase n=1 Tax=Methylocella sp. TaxID=1978226 RepID=UPI0037845FE3